LRGSVAERSITDSRRMEKEQQEQEKQQRNLEVQRRRELAER
jgi:hypothetical protein